MASAKLLVLLALVLAVACLALSDEQPVRRCDLDSAETHASRVIHAKEDLLAMKAKKAKKKAKNKKPAPEPLYEMRVMFHVLRDDKGKEGHVPLDSILANIKNTNDVLSGAANTRAKGHDTRLRVRLTGVTYTNNSKWFYNCQDYNVMGEIKASTTLSAATTVNVHTCYSTNLLGWVYFLPYELAQHSVWNGVHINYRSLPASRTDRSYQNYENFADGDTFTHEFGHYLGLLHTFGDGVNGCQRGDNIDDTPAEASPAQGRVCLQNPPRDTCPDLPGVDPVWNIMDYADDICAQELTPDQGDVMRYSINTYKKNLVTLEPARCVADGRIGTASHMTVCKSECFRDRSTPDGKPAPANGWCRTDKKNWGACCCGDSCSGEPVVAPSPVALPCGRVQTREELWKPAKGSTLCATADIGGDQVYMSTCGMTPFHRWSFNFDGSILSIGTGLCVAVLDYNGPTTLEGKQLGLRPCEALAPSQRFVQLPANGASTKLSLYAAPNMCVDSGSGVFVMKPCTSQLFARSNKPSCSSRKNKQACLKTVTTLGCKCRWVKKKCIS